jgi:hypothetical protein
MKLLVLLSIGLAMAFPVVAQTTTPTEKQEPAQEETGKAQTKQTAKPNPNRTGDVNQSAQPSGQERHQMGAQENANPNMRERTRTNEQSGFRPERREGARVQERGGNMSHGVTVFRNGRETTENLNLRRSTREQSDMHFRIGTHDRDWWLRSYSIVLMDGCHYYLANNGCWYPAYGFDPSCDYPPGVVYCE